MRLRPGSGVGGTTGRCCARTPTVTPSIRSTCDFAVLNRRRSVMTLPPPETGLLPSTPAAAKTVGTPCSGNRSEAGRSAATSCPSARWCHRMSRPGRLLGVTTAVRRFDELLGLAHRHPQVRQWVVDHPLRALELAAEMPQLIAAYTWLDGHRQSHRYLREISAPGVDTKFAERHRPVLAAMLRGASDSFGIPCGPWP